MTANGTLTQNRRRFILALLEARNVRDAAKRAGVGERTAWRYLADPGVKVERAARQDAMLHGVTAGLVADMAEARAVLLEVMRDPGASDATRTRAAGIVLDCGLRLLELLSLAERVAELERRLEGE